MAEATTTGEAPKREEQVLVLAAGGLTDKEIAIRLGISPDTVGTYWRRILAKYQAASRTEVVAKYAEDRSKAAVQNLEYVNECLKLVADHMIEQAGFTGRGIPAPKASVADTILSVSTDWIILINPSGLIEFSNIPVPPSTRLSNLVSNEDLNEVLSLAAQMETDSELEVKPAAQGKLAECYSFRFWPVVEGLQGRIVGIGRSF